MTRNLSRGQKAVVIVSSVPMLAVGGVGAWGTFSNVQSEFQRAATAAGVVAAGEGLVLILALVMLLVTMFGQTAPTPVRVGLWLAPVAAAVTGIAVADGWRERVVYAITPLAMSGAAEGLAFVARRIVVYLDGVDMEGQRQNADAVQRLAYQSALAAGHPGKWVRKRAERKAWRIAARVGRGDPALAGELLTVQNTRVTAGADAALSGMFPGATAQADKPSFSSDRHSARRKLAAHFATMDPADAVRIAADAHPDMPPAELASLLVAHGVVVDAVAVALVLGQEPPEYEVHRPDTPAHQQVNALPAVNLQGAVLEAASTLGADASPRAIAEHLEQHRRLVVDEPYIRTVLHRAAKKPQPAPPAKPMEGGYA